MPINPESFNEAPENLTNEAQVKTLMSSSKSEKEWNDNLEKVKAANNDKYPDFWFGAIMISGLAAQTAEKWAGKV